MFCVYVRCLPSPALQLPCLAGARSAGGRDGETGRPEGGHMDQVWYEQLPDGMHDVLVGPQGGLFLAGFDSLRRICLVLYAPPFGQPVCSRWRGLGLGSAHAGTCRSRGTVAHY